MADRRRNRTKWALVASLALNVAFLGMIAGAFIKGPPPAPWPGITLWQYARALPDPYRADLGRSLREKRDDWVGPREALRAQRTALAAALTTEPYAADNVASVLGQEARFTTELSDRGVDLLLVQIDRMSPEERTAYAAALLEDKKGRDHGRGPGPDGGKGPRP